MGIFGYYFDEGWQSIALNRRTQQTLTASIWTFSIQSASILRIFPINSISMLANRQEKTLGECIPARNRNRKSCHQRDCKIVQLVGHGPTLPMMFIWNPNNPDSCFKYFEWHVTSFLAFVCFLVNNRRRPSRWAAVLLLFECCKTQSNADTTHNRLVNHDTESHNAPKSDPVNKRLMHNRTLWSNENHMSLHASNIKSRVDVRLWLLTNSFITSVRKTSYYFSLKVQTWKKAFIRIQQKLSNKIYFKLLNRKLILINIKRMSSNDSGIYSFSFFLKSNYINDQ